MVHTASFLPNAGCLSNSCLAWRSGNCSLSTYRPRTQQYAEAVGQWTVSGCFVHPQREGLPGDEVTLSGTLSAGGHTHGGLCLVLCRFHGPPPVLDRSERCFDPLDFTGKDASGIKQKGTKGHTARTRQNLNPALPDAKPQPRSIFMWEWGGVEAKGQPQVLFLKHHPSWLLKGGLSGLELWEGAGQKPPGDHLSLPP